MKPLLLVAAGILVRGDHVLLTRRPEGKHLAGKWEFPGGKVKDHESPREALAREIQEELGVGIRHIHPFGFSWYEYEDRRVLLLAFLGEPVSEPARTDLEWRWWPLDRLDPDVMPPADRPIVGALATRRV